MILSPSFYSPFSVGGFNFPIQEVRPQTTLPLQGAKMPSLTGALQGAGSGAATGTAVNPGWGTAIGGVLGGIAGLFPKKGAAAPAGSTAEGLAAPSGSVGTLLGALGAGLSTIPFTRNEQTNVQTQTVNQDNAVNVSNIIGGRPFGGVDTETGEFDIFQTMADVFAIREAQKASIIAGPAAGAAAGAAKEEGQNISGLLLLAGGALLLVYFLTGKGK